MATWQVKSESIFYFQLCGELVEVLIFISESHNLKKWFCMGSDIVHILLKPSVHNLSPTHDWKSKLSEISFRLLQATDRSIRLPFNQISSSTRSVISSNYKIFVSETIV